MSDSDNILIPSIIVIIISLAMNAGLTNEIEVLQSTKEPSQLASHENASLVRSKDSLSVSTASIAELKLPSNAQNLKENNAA